MTLPAAPLAIGRRGLLKAIGAGLILAGINLGLSEAPALEPQQEVWGHWVFDPPLVFNGKNTIAVDHRNGQLIVYHADGVGRTLRCDAVPHPLAFAINSLGPYA